MKIGSGQKKLTTRERLLFSGHEEDVPHTESALQVSTDTTHWVESPWPTHYYSLAQNKTVKDQHEHCAVLHPNQRQ